jgi:hypothetical protein
MEKTYLKHNGYVVELTALARDNGTVEHPEKGMLYLLQPAYMSDSDRTVYQARAIDAVGNEYLVRWDTTDAWEDAYAECREEQERTGDYSYVSSYLEDESNACDWNSPAVIELIAEGEYYLIPSIAE